MAAAGIQPRHLRGLQERRIRETKLILLVVLTLLLVTLHLVDHVLRGDLHRPLSLESLPFIVVSLVIYGILGSGLWLTWKNKVGPRFWTVLSVLGLAFGWISHFSPFTDQNTTAIRAAYQSPIAGWLAVACLLALMLILMVGAIYAGYLWARSASRR